MKTNSNFEVKSTLKTLKDLQVELEKIMKEDFGNKKEITLMDLNKKFIAYCELIRSLAFDKNFIRELGPVAIEKLKNEHLTMLNKFGTSLSDKVADKSSSKAKSNKYKLFVEIVKDSSETTK